MHKMSFFKFFRIFKKRYLGFLFTILFLLLYYYEKKEVAFATPFSFSYSSINLIPLRSFSTGVIKS